MGHEFNQAGYYEIDGRQAPGAVKAVILDIDRTLTSPDFFSWVAFTAAVAAGEAQPPMSAVNGAQGTAVDSMRSLFGQFSRGEIELSAAIYGWLQIWHMGGVLTRQRVNEVTGQIVREAITTEVKETVTTLQNQNMHLAVVSAAYREFVRGVADDLDIELARHNPEFSYHRPGRQHAHLPGKRDDVVGFRYNPRETERKKGQIRRLAQKWGISTRDLVMVDDKPTGLTRAFPVISLNGKDGQYPIDTWRVIQQFTNLPQALLGS